MLTFIDEEQLALLEAEVERVCGLTFKQFDELASYVSRVSAMTGLSAEDVTQILQGASAHTGISMSDLAKTLEELVVEIKEEGGREDMSDYNVRTKSLGNYKGHPVEEISLNDFITLVINRETKQDMYYVITENLSVVFNNWVIGRINESRRNITEVKHVSVKAAFGAEIIKRTNPTLGHKEMSKGMSNLITARPAIAAYVREGEKKLEEQSRRGRELVEALKRPE